MTRLELGTAFFALRGVLVVVHPALALAHDLNVRYVVVVSCILFTYVDVLGRERTTSLDPYSFR